MHSRRDLRLQNRRHTLRCTSAMADTFLTQKRSDEIVDGYVRGRAARVCDCAARDGAGTAGGPG